MVSGVSLIIIIIFIVIIINFCFALRYFIPQGLRNYVKSSIWNGYSSMSLKGLMNVPLKAMALKRCIVTERR
jgi:hypothetical protein